MAAEAMDFSLSVTPKICVSRGDESCSMDMEISWSSLQAADVCLRLGDTGVVLQCWEMAREGTFAMRYSSLANVALQLVNGAEKVVEEVVIKVVSRDLRDSRRRRRHVWSIL